MAVLKRRVGEAVLNVFAMLGLILLLIQLTLSFFVFVQNVLSSEHENFIFIGGLSRDSNEVSKGFVVHRWLYLCGLTSLRTLYQSNLFPKYPDDSIIIKHRLLHYSPNKALGVRMTGYLTVPESGFYSFKLNSIGMAELWMKIDDNGGLQKLAKSKVVKLQDRNRVYWSDVSNEVFMEEDKTYPFEIFNAGEFVELKWLLPGSTQFTKIDNRYTSHNTASHSHEVLASLFPKEKYRFENGNPIGCYYFVSFIPKWVIDSAIPGCSFTEKDQQVNKVTRHNGVNMLTLYDDFDGKKKDLWKQNAEVQKIVLLYMDGLEKIYRLKYRANRVYKMEKLKNIENHMPLYMMQLEFKVDGLNYKQRVIQYVYQVNTTSICQPIHLKWYRDAVINVIIVLKDHEKAIKLFIDRFEQVFEKSLEVDLHIIIVQFGQSAIDIKAHVDNTSLVQRYSVIYIDGLYSRSRGMNRAVSLAKGDHAIILTCDVHTDIPDTLFEDTRTHCIQGHVAFSPVFFQLECGEDPGRTNPRGYWCYQNYSIIGIHKTDWDKISGMDLRQSDQKEDWNLIKKIRRSGMAVVRHTYLGLYRYYTPYMGYVPMTSVPIKAGFLERDDTD